MSDRAAPGARPAAFTADSRWIRRAARPAPALRLICVPYAGGGASVFSRLPALLPEQIEVIVLQLPGREDRTRELAPDSLPDLIAACSIALRPYTSAPYAFYGHCAGALLAYEIAQAIGERSGAWPVRLVAGAQAAPHLPPPQPLLHPLPDPELLDVIRSRGGLPATVAANTELLDVLIPLLRSDFALWENYVHRPRPPLPCPVTTLRGRQDGIVTAEAAASWAGHTTAGHTYRAVDGGHYFVNDHVEQTAGALADAVLATSPTAD
ncbi:MAG TPA: thioesterase domain-containing protein [Actinocrinis sp.]|nr:thioesterase domain-containing protein [Actinocrinis sp.]